MQSKLCDRAASDPEVLADTKINIFSKDLTYAVRARSSYQRLALAVCPLTYAEFGGIFGSIQLKL